MKIPLISLLEQQQKSMSLAMLWALSVLLEPLLYFVLADQTQIGFAGNISRLLQFFVMALIAAHFLSGRCLRISTYARNLCFPLSLFILYAFVVSLFGFFFGTYSGGQTWGDQAGLSSVFQSNKTRPVVELFILIFQFFYFVILPMVLLRTKRDLDFLFRCAFFFLSVHFIAGWIDFILTPLGVDLISRHLADGRSVGLRFHGLAGEPRDAAVYMMSLFFFVATYYFYRNGSVPLLKKTHVAIIAVSCLATVSASFLVAVCASLLLWLTYGLRRISADFIVRSLILVIVFFLIVGFSISYFERLDRYLTIYQDNLVKLYQDPHQDLPRLVKNSFNNIYPIIHVLKEFDDGKIFPLFFGHGAGGSGVANSIIYGEYNNPNNQFARLIFDYGVVGTLLFIFLFIQSIKRSVIGMPSLDRDRLVSYGLIMLGGVFAHRTNVWLIWLGILMAVSNYRCRATNLCSSPKKRN